jgi:hypothetical protein
MLTEMAKFSAKHVIRAHDGRFCFKQSAGAQYKILAKMRRRQLNRLRQPARVQSPRARRGPTVHGRDRHGRLNIAPHVVDCILNHVSGTIRGVAAVYNRHPYLDERKAALEAWGAT